MNLETPAPRARGENTVRDSLDGALKATPYWWEDAPLAAAPQTELPEECDVAIIGAGYTGLGAAIELARAGRSVQVLDAMLPGEGASSRNGGMTSGSIRPGRDALVRRFGETRADDILHEGKAARDDLYAFIAQENIDCDFALSGRAYGAISAGHYDKLATDAEYLAKTLGVEAFAVPRASQSDWIGTEAYHGLNVRMDIGGLHPAKLHREMLRVAREAGAVVHGRTPSQGVRSERDGHSVKTPRGVLRARDVIVGTNGYSDGSDQWLRQRLVPVRSRIIATEELSAELVRRLFPHLSMCGDTRRLSYYYRPSPDGRRVLFGGRDGSISGDPQWPTRHLMTQLCRIFPELSGVRLSHSWYGNVAMNRDMIPRIFARDGRRYAVGYCGSGVVWARWAGRKAAWSVLGMDDRQSAFDFRAPGLTPTIAGKAWFMPGVFAWLSLRDRLTKSGVG